MLTMEPLRVHFARSRGWGRKPRDFATVSSGTVLARAAAVGGVSGFRFPAVPADRGKRNRSGCDPAAIRGAFDAALVDQFLERLDHGLDALAGGVGGGLFGVCVVDMEREFRGTGPEFERQFGAAGQPPVLGVEQDAAASAALE